MTRTEMAGLVFTDIVKRDLVSLLKTNYGVEDINFKENFLTYSTNSSHEGTIADKVDSVIKDIAGDRNNSFPFFYIILNY